MEFDDGATQEIAAVFDEIYDDLDEAVKNAARSVIDEETKAFENGVLADVPVRTGGLRASLKVEKVSGRINYHGYDVQFEGNAPDGTPYQKIASVLDKGRPANEQAGAISGTFFVTKRVRKLKGMDERIEARIEAEIVKRT